MKDRLYKNILKDPYNVTDLYYKDGIFQFIARQQAFEAVTLLIVMINALWIGFDADKNTADALPDAPIGFQVMENLFCSYFTVEIAIRFLAFEQKYKAFKDLQFVLDLGLVILMIFETWCVYIFVLIGSSASTKGTSLFRILRLTRMARLMRLLRAFPELMVLLKGIKAATKSVAWTSVLLIIIIYVFGVAFRILAGSSSTGYFSSVPKSMATFFLDGLLPDFAPPVRTINDDSTILAVLFMLFIVIGSITVMNMLTGMLVQVVSSIADVSQEELKLCWVKDRMSEVMDSLDVNKDGHLSREEVEKVLMDVEACRVIADVGVDVVQLVEVAEFHIFKDQDHITFREFLDLVLQLRKAKQVCMKDIVSLQQFVSVELCALEDRLLKAMGHVTNELGSAIQSQPSRSSAVGHKESNRSTATCKTESLW